MSKKKSKQQKYISVNSRQAAAKNVAPSKISKGNTLRTRDEFFQGQKGKKIHPEIPKSELYRPVATIEVNEKGEMAVVKMSTKQKGKGYIPLEDYRDGKSYVRPEVLTKDENKQPLRAKAGRMELNRPEFDLTEEQINKITKICNNSKSNRKRLNAFRKQKD
jgi:hypothetical protein